MSFKNARQRKAVMAKMRNISRLQNSLRIKQKRLDSLGKKQAGFGTVVLSAPRAFGIGVSIGRTKEKIAFEKKRLRELKRKVR